MVMKESVAIATTEAIPTRERSTQKRPLDPPRVNLAGDCGRCGQPFCI